MIKKLITFTIIPLLLIALGSIVFFFLPTSRELLYFETEMCIEGESSEVLKTYNGKQNRAKFVNHVVTTSTDICESSIHDLTIFIVEKVKQKNNIQTINNKHISALNTKIKISMSEKYTKNILKNFDAIQEITNKTQGTPQKVDEALHTLKEQNKLKNFIEEKRKENNKNINDMARFLEKRIKTEK